ncbi:MAG: hypothetical protein Q8P38_01050 [Candidatus Nanopelagicales bacterium]|nr:hypothetical protein [Candidatus Nanopelagicales bacterium]
MRLMMSENWNGSVGVVDAGRMVDMPDPQVAPRAKPRSFTAAYKKKVLAEYEATPRGERGALLRRESLYSTLIHKWQHQAAKAVDEAFAGHRPGPKPDAAAKELARMARENERLAAELATSRRINDVQAKLSAYTGDRSCQVPVVSSW